MNTAVDATDSLQLGTVRHPAPGGESVPFFSDWQSACQHLRSQRLYYRVFKPAVQSVKQCHHRNRNMYGKLIRSDYALLKDVLPHLSQLKYEHWILLRQRCRRNEPALPATARASE